MLDRNKWQQINNDSTGYVGKYRNDEWQKRDEIYGIGQWQMAWLVNGQYLEYIEVCQLYEDAYFHYFEQRPELLEHLLGEASDVYDDSPDNIDSGLDYLKRGVVRTHIQDIAIRNCIQRFGKKFQGSQLIQIRDRLGTHPLSLALSPGQVPFHKPEWLSFPDNLKAITKEQWWLPGSVEDFYQRAKRLCVIK
ncbi:MAG: hypothetical protein ABH884_01985 [Candidatus Komeilibacteria bacterium]